MSGPRGMSIFERNAYEFGLLSALPVALPDHPQITRIAVCAANGDPRRDGRCADAAKMIMNDIGLTSRFTLEVRESNRGRNNYDYILHNRISPEPVILEVKVAKSGTGNDYSERRLRCWNLLEILSDALPSDEQAMIWQKWEMIRKIMEENAGKDWDDLPDRHASVFEPARDLLKETAGLLQSHGSGIMPRLWELLYGMPILRVIFAKKDTYIQFIAPASQFDPREASICDTPAGIGMIEGFRSGSTKIRVHNLSRKIAVTGLAAGISFTLPDEAYTRNVLRYRGPDAAEYSTVFPS